MNEIFFALALGFAAASFSWVLVEPLLSIPIIRDNFNYRKASLYIWTQRAIAAIFAILWWL